MMQVVCTVFQVLAVYTFLVSSSNTRNSPGAPYKGYLLHNKLVNGSIPRSYTTWPADFFSTLPEKEREHKFSDSFSTYVPSCKRNVTGKEMNAYSFQTEELLVGAGLNIYDGAVRCIALSILGEESECQDYIQHTLVGDHTTAFTNGIRGNAPCEGVIEWGQCSDPLQVGKCGMCYGDGSDKTLSKEYAYFFRMISDVWDFQGTVDQRCPETNQTFKWNDYTPVLGGNSWAILTGPAQNAMVRAGYDYNKVPDNDPAFLLGIPFLHTLEVMKIGDTGAFYYAPRNTWFGFSKAAQNVGSTFSVENQASLLAGLSSLYQLIDKRSSTTYKQHLPTIMGYIKGLKKILLESYDSDYGFFRQGGTYNLKTKTISWTQNGSPSFAVDCQTWVSTVLGTPTIDATFGNGTAYRVWQKTKELSHYDCPISGFCGVGYTMRNISGQVLSGEWSYGAMNWLQMMTHDSGYGPDMISSLKADLSSMEFGLYKYIETAAPVNGGGTSYDCAKYADSRYFIPFGWYANPIPATASTAWAVFVKEKYNPFNINKGAYSAYTL